METDISGVHVIEPNVFVDMRGYFMESWHKQKFSEMGIETDFVQDNQSESSKNTLRGLHYQIKNIQGKLVRVLKGEIFDVAIDIRSSSMSFGKWTGQLLSAENKKMLWIPPGFAHGFLVLSDIAEILYKCTDYYSPEHERCIRWDDETIGINWPLEQNILPIISDKDAEGKSLCDAEIFT